MSKIINVSPDRFNPTPTRLPEEDVTITKIDGRDEALLSAAGTIKFAYIVWREDRNQKAKEAIERFCQTTATKRYGKGSRELMSELERVSVKQGMELIQDIFDTCSITANDIQSVFRRI